ncbi:hypothetical protein RB200_24285 [Streptomyces sp. PmtG]
MPWPRRLAALVRACLLAVMVLCAAVHGPLDEHHGPPPAATAAGAAAPTALDAAPHQPHEHHGSEECAPDGPLRTPAAPTTELPPAPAGAVTAVGALVLPWRPCRRAAHRRRRTRPGRTALARTARWRI